MNPAEKYILDQPDPYKEILLYTQTVIEMTLPNLMLKYKYRIPFYYLNGKPFCYLNASHKKQYVDIGFCKGKQLSIHINALVTEKRKKMASLRYKSVAEIDESILVDVLQNARALYD